MHIVQGIGSRETASPANASWSEFLNLPEILSLGPNE